MADELSSAIKYGSTIAKLALDTANMGTKIVGEAEKILDDILRFETDRSFEKKAAEMLKAKIKEGQDLCVLDCQTPAFQDEIVKSLTRLGIPFVKATINDNPCVIYASDDHEIVRGTFEETQDLSKQVPLERLKDEQCVMQHSNESNIQMLKSILDENNIPYSINDSCDIIYPQKYEEKVKIANDAIAYQNQFPEVKKYQLVRDENIKKNINTFVLLSNGKLNEDNQHIVGIDKNSKNIGFFDKDGSGVFFDGNRVLVLGTEDGKNTLNIFNRNEFIKTEEYALFFDKLSRNPNLMLIQKDGMSEELRKNGASKEIIEKIKKIHQENSLKIYALSKEEEDRLNEISKMTQVFIIDEHPGGYKEMKLARCIFSSQAIISSLREPDLDGPMDNKFSADIKNTAKEESEEIEYRTITKEEYEKLTSLEEILGEGNEEAISRANEMVEEFSREETSIIQGN